jgi:tetratricopeptide (TPR) repeat protein
LQDAGSSGDSTSSSSSSSSSSNSEDPTAGPLGEDDDAAAKAAAARRSERRRKATELPQTPSQREEEDLNVAEFYQNDRNYKGAYDRATDAVSIAADDPNAHFALAEAARRLGKLDEAMKHYKACLTLDPVPKMKKAAEAALKQMAGN